MFQSKINISKWKKYKKSGTYRRLLSKNRAVIVATTTGSVACENTLIENSSAFKIIPCSSNQNANSIPSNTRHGNDDEIDENLNDETYYEGFGDFSDESVNDIENIDNDASFQEELRIWAITNNIRHTAINLLLKILKKRTKSCLPLDARTLLETPKDVVLTTLGRGIYWHQGLEVCLKYNLHDINKPLNISLNFNIDGLPIYKSSKNEFWPILFNIYELPTIKPMVVGIWSGIGKPPSAEEFLR